MAIQSSPFPTQTIRSTNRLGMPTIQRTAPYSGGGFSAPSLSVRSHDLSALRSVLEEIARKQQEDAMFLPNVSGASDTASSRVRTRAAADMYGMMEDTSEKKRPWWLTGLGIVGGTAGLSQNAMFGAKDAFFKNTDVGRSIEGWNKGKPSNFGEGVIEALEDAAGLGYNVSVGPLSQIGSLRRALDKKALAESVAMFRGAEKQVKKGYNAEDTLGSSEMLTEWGLPRDKGTVGGTARDIAALGLDIVLDPQNALFFGASSLAKQGGKAAAGSMTKLGIKAAEEAAESVGTRVATSTALRAALNEAYEAMAKNSSDVIPALSKSTFIKTILDPDNYDTSIAMLSRYVPEDEAADKVINVLAHRAAQEESAAAAKAAAAKVITVGDVIEDMKLPSSVDDVTKAWRAKEIQRLEPYLKTPISELGNSPAGQALDQFVRRMSPGYGMVGLEIPFTGVGESFFPGTRAAISDALAIAKRPTGGIGGLYGLVPNPVRKAFSKTYGLERELGSKSAASAAQSIEMMSEVARNQAQHYSALQVDELSQLYKQKVADVKLGRTFTKRSKREQIKNLAEIIGVTKELAYKREINPEASIRLAKDALYQTNRDGIRRVAKDGSTVFEVRLGDDAVKTFVPETMDDAGIEKARKLATEYADNYSLEVERTANDVASSAEKAVKGKRGKTAKAKRVRTGTGVPEDMEITWDSASKTDKLAQESIKEPDNFKFQREAVSKYIASVDDNTLYAEMRKSGIPFKKTKTDAGVVTEPSASYPKDRFVQITSSPKFDTEIQVDGATPNIDSLWYMAQDVKDKQWYAYRADGIQVPKGDRTGKAFKNADTERILLGSKRPDNKEAHRIIASSLLAPYDLPGAQNINKQYIFMNKPTYDSRGAMRFINNDESDLSEYGLVIDGRVGRIVNRDGKVVQGLGELDAATATDIWIAKNTQWRNSIPSKTVRDKWSLGVMTDPTERLDYMRKIHTAVESNVFYHDITDGQVAAANIFGEDSIYRQMGYLDKVNGTVTSADGDIPMADLIVGKSRTDQNPLSRVLYESKTGRTPVETNTELADIADTEELMATTDATKSKFSEFNRIEKPNESSEQYQTELRLQIAAAEDIQKAKKVELDRATRRLRLAEGAIDKARKSSADETEMGKLLASRNRAESALEAVQREFDDATRVIDDYNAGNKGTLKYGAGETPSDIEIAAKNIQTGSGKSGTVATDIDQGAVPVYIDPNGTYMLEQVGPDKWEFILLDSAGDINLRDIGEFNVAGIGGRGKGGRVARGTGVFFTHDEIFGTGNMPEIPGAPNAGIRDNFLLSPREFGRKSDAARVANGVSRAGTTGGITTPDGFRAFMDRIFDEVHPSQFNNRFLDKWTTGTTGEAGQFIPTPTSMSAEELAAGAGTGWMRNPKYRSHLTDFEEAVRYKEEIAEKLNTKRLKPEPMSLPEGVATQKPNPLIDSLGRDRKVNVELIRQDADNIINEAMQTDDASKIAPGIPPVEPVNRVVQVDTPARFRLKKRIDTHNKTLDKIDVVENENGTVTLKLRSRLDESGKPINRDAATAVSEELGTFDTAEDAVDYINTFRMVLDPKNKVKTIDDLKIADAIGKLIDAGVLEDGANSQVLVGIFREIIEKEKGIFENMSVTESNAGLKYASELQDYYSPGAVPIRGELSELEKTLYSTFGADPGMIQTNMRNINDILPGANKAEIGSHEMRLRNLLGIAEPGERGFQKDKSAYPNLMFRARDRDNGLPFEMNMLKRMETRAQSGSLQMSRENLMDAFARTFGSRIDNGQYIRNGKSIDVKTGGLMGERHVMDTMSGQYYIDDNVRRVFDSIFDNQPKELTGMQNLTSQYLVPLMTVFKPAFIVNNTVGNIDLALRNGMLGPQELLHQKKILGYIDTLDGGDDLLTIAGKTYKVKDVAEDQLKRGVISFSGRDPYLMESGLEEMAGMYNTPGIGAYMRFMRSLNTRSENMFRGAAYLKGVYRRGYDPNVATSIVNDVLFDYTQSGLTQTEKGLRKYVPFYNWTRRNVPASIDFVRRKPFLAYNLYGEGMATLSNDPNRPGEDVTLKQLGEDFWMKSLTPFQQENGIPIMRGGQYINPKLPMGDAMSFVGLGQDIVRGFQGKNPDVLMDVANFGSGFVGPAPKELAKLLLQRDEFGNPLVQEGEFLGMEGAPSGALGGVLNAAVGMIPGVSTITNAITNENKYKNSGGRKGNQYALDNLLPRIEDGNKIAPGSWLSSQSPQLIDQEKVRNDWATKTDYELQDMFAREEQKGGALPTGEEDMQVYFDLALRTPPQNVTQTITQAKMQQLNDAVDNLNLEGMPEEEKQLIRNEILFQRMQLVEAFFKVDPNKPLQEQMPRFPLNAGLKGMTIGIPEQYKNANAGIGYDQQMLSEDERRKQELYWEHYNGLAGGSR